MKSTSKGEGLSSLLVIAGMAFRNLSRHLTATVLLGGVIGFGIMVVSLLQGCAGAVMGNVSANVATMAAGHVYVQGYEKLPSGRQVQIIRDDAPLMQALKDSKVDVSYVSRRAEFNATLVYESSSTMQTITGVDFKAESFLMDRLKLAPGGGSFDALSDPKAIVISDKMAEKLRVKPGYRVLAQLQTVTGQQTVGEFNVAAIVQDAGVMSVGSMSAYAHRDYVNKLLNLPEGSYQMLSFFIPDMKKLDQVGDSYYAALSKTAQVFPRQRPGSGQQEVMARLRGEQAETWNGTRYRMTTLNEELSGLQTLVNNINYASVIALVVLFFVIMVGIMNTFRMIMLDRIKEIGTMRALGMQKWQVLLLFLFEALFLSLCGATAGLCLGLLLIGGFSLINFGQGSFLALFLHNGHLGFALNPLLVLGNFGIIAFLTLLAALLPAIMAARMEPAVALRTAK